MPKTLTSLLTAVHKAARSFKRDDADTIDGQPSFERYILEHGKVVDRSLDAAMRPLWSPIVSSVREAMDCPTCELCDVLVRRYAHGERRAVPMHRDINAYVTAVLTLNAEAFSGGYFVVSHDGVPTGVGEQQQQQQPHVEVAGAAAARLLHLNLGSGDLLIHDHRVQHGVNVTSGERLSLIGWFKDRPGLCEDDDNAWVHDLAEAGDADAMAQLANHAQARGDSETSQLWARRAADAGHAGAMVQVAFPMFRSRRAADHAEALALVARASHLGRRDAMAFYAWALDKGAGGPSDPVAALRWRRRAAALGHAGARRELEAAGLPLG